MIVSITVMQWDSLVMSISNSVLRFGDGWGQNSELNGPIAVLEYSCLYWMPTS